MFSGQALGTRSGPSLPSEAFPKDISFTYSGQSCNGLDGVLFDTQSLGNFQSLGIFSDLLVYSSPDSLQQLGAILPTPISSPFVSYGGPHTVLPADVASTDSIVDKVKLHKLLSNMFSTHLDQTGLKHNFLMPFSKVNASSHIVESHQGMLLTQSAVDKFQVSTGQYYSPLVAQIPASIITSEPSTSKKRKIDREGTAEHKCVHPGCELAFKRRGNLNAHMLTHTGERPFQCDSCEKCFSRNHDLTRHRKGHTGARPFVCTRCNRGFARADALRRHTSKDSSCKRSTRTERRKTKAK